MAERVSGSSLEVLSGATASERVSGAALEVLSGATANERVSGVALEVLSGVTSNMRVSGVVLEVLADAPPPIAHLTRESMEVIFVDAPNTQNLDVQTIALEVWAAAPKLGVQTSAMEAWATETNGHLRAGASALEAWVTGTGSLRVGTAALEAWVNAPVAVLSLSFGPPSPPKLNLGSNRLLRNLTLRAGPPQLMLRSSVISVFDPFALPGFTWPISKELVYGVLTQNQQSGKNLRVAMWADPVWHYVAKFEFLRSGPDFLEQQALLGLFLQSMGQYGPFLFDDPDDDIYTHVIFGDVINSSQTVFQLLRGFYDNQGNLLATAPIYAPQGGVGIYQGTGSDGSGGTLVDPSTYTVIPYGKVVFNAPFSQSGPPGNHWFLAASGLFYQLCRFEDDQQDFDGLWNDFWELGQLRFKTVKPAP